jgi:integrase
VVKQQLSALPRRGGLVFPSRTGNHQDGTTVLHQFQKRLAAAGLPRMRFHDLRHGTASLLKTRGVDLREIMAILGPSQIALTANLYTRVAPEVMGGTAARMDAILGEDSPLVGHTANGWGSGCRRGRRR